MEISVQFEELDQSIDVEFRGNEKKTLDVSFGEFQ